MSEFDFDVRAAIRESAHAAPLLDPAAEAFAVWFVNNYPTDSVLSNPAWHAARIYRASLAARQQATSGGKFAEWMTSAVEIVRKRYGGKSPDEFNEAAVWMDRYATLYRAVADVVSRANVVLDGMLADLDGDRPPLPERDRHA